MSDITDVLEQRLRVLVETYDTEFDHAARAAGLSAAQACLLMCLVRSPCAMGELASELVCDASNVTQIVRRLEGRGLVARTPDPTDRRARQVSITDAGRDQQAAVERGFTFPAQRIARLSPADQLRLVDLLDTLLAPD